MQRYCILNSSFNNFINNNNTQDNQLAEAYVNAYVLPLRIFSCNYVKNSDGSGIYYFLASTNIEIKKKVTL